MKNFLFAAIATVCMISNVQAQGTQQQAEAAKAQCEIDGPAAGTAKACWEAVYYPIDTKAGNLAALRIAAVQNLEFRRYNATQIASMLAEADGQRDAALAFRTVFLNGRDQAWADIGLADNQYISGCNWFIAHVWIDARNMFLSASANYNAAIDFYNWTSEMEGMETAADNATYLYEAWAEYDVDAY